MKRLIVTFPFPIKQVGPAQIEIPVIPAAGPLIVLSALEQLAPSLNEEQLDLLLEDILAYAVEEAIKRQMKITRSN